MLHKKEIPYNKKKAEAYYLRVFASEYSYNRYSLSNYLQKLTGCNIRS